MKFTKRRKRAFMVSIVVICLLTIILTASSKYNPGLFRRTVGFVLTPIQGAFSSVGTWASNKIEFLTHINELEDENKRLLLENNNLILENTRLRLSEQKVNELSELLNIDQKYSDYKKTGALIIAKDPGNWYNTFTIDKGSNSGLMKNMVVLASGGLVGKITEVGANYSRVVALIDDTSYISAKGARTGDRGSVRGDLNLMLEGLCVMDNIDANAEIDIGDEIVTSQLSSVYPPGITIGYVTDISSNSLGVKKAVIKPVVDFENLETVLVIAQLFEHSFE